MNRIGKHINNEKKAFSFPSQITEENTHKTKSLFTDSKKGKSIVAAALMEVKDEVLVFVLVIEI